jgi:hypothetical protein
MINNQSKNGDESEKGRLIPPLIFEISFSSATLAYIDQYAYDFSCKIFSACTY